MIYRLAKQTKVMKRSFKVKSQLQNDQIQTLIRKLKTQQIKARSSLKWELALRVRIPSREPSPQHNKHEDSLVLAFLPRFGSVLFKSEKLYNTKQKFSEAGRTKQAQLTTTFMKVFSHLLNLFSNGDQNNFLEVLIRHHFLKIFPENYLWKIQAFDDIAQSLAKAYQLQTAREGKLQILSLVSPYVPSKHINEIFGAPISSRQIWNANLSQLVNGVGVCPPRTEKKVVYPHTDVKTLNLIKAAYQYSSTAYPHQVGKVDNRDSAYFNKLTFNDEPTQVYQRLHLPIHVIHQKMVEQYGAVNCFNLSSTYKFFRAHHFTYSKQLTALCDQCSKNGFTNLRDFKGHLDSIAVAHPQFSSNIVEIKRRLDHYHDFLRVDLHNHLSDTHTKDATHCLHYLFNRTQQTFGCHHTNFSPCKEKHEMGCFDCNERFHIQKTLAELSGKIQNVAFDGQSIKYFDKLDRYYGHLIRTNIQKKVTSLMLSLNWIHSMAHEYL